MRADELARVQNGRVAGFLYALDNAGGFGGVADRLNAYNIFLGDPGRILSDLDRYRACTGLDLKRVASAYIDSANVSARVMAPGRPRPAIKLPLSQRPPAPAVAYRAPCPEAPPAGGARLWMIPRATCRSWPRPS